MQLSPILFASTVGSDIAEHCSDFWPELLFTAFIAGAFASDIWRVVTGKTSWSLLIWQLNYLHPTLIVLEVLLGGGVCYLVRHSWPCVMVNGALMIGHLAASNEYQPPPGASV